MLIAPVKQTNWIVLQAENKSSLLISNIWLLCVRLGFRGVMVQFRKEMNNFVLPHCRPNCFRFWCHSLQHPATLLTALMLTVVLIPMPQRIHAVVQRNKFQWPPQWAKFLSTTAAAFSCIALMISTTFCVVLIIHFIHSKCAQMPECVGWFIHYSFVGCGCCCNRNISPPLSHVPSTGGTVIYRFIFNEFQVILFLSKKKEEKFRHYILLMRSRSDSVSTLKNSSEKWLKMIFHDVADHQFLNNIKNRPTNMSTTWSLIRETLSDRTYFGPPNFMGKFITGNSDKWSGK